MRADPVTDPICYHAEGPVWWPSWGLRWVDMLAGDVMTLRPDGEPTRTHVGTVVACLRPARLVTFDDVDATLTIDELVALHAALDVLKDHGHPFAVSAVASAPVPRDAVVLTLPPVREN